MIVVSSSCDLMGSLCNNGVLVDVLVYGRSGGRGLLLQDFVMAPRGFRYLAMKA
jgi:hypothetical protein